VKVAHAFYFKTRWSKMLQTVFTNEKNKNKMLTFSSQTQQWTPRLPE